MRFARCVMGPLAAAVALVAGAERLPAQGGVDFAADVLPILESRCMRCHKAPYKDERGRVRKPKAGLRLDGAGWIRRGSDDGRVLAPGQPEKSLLYSLAALPADDRDRMPQKGDPLTAEELATVRQWIEGGAAFGDWVGAPGPAAADTGSGASTQRLPSRAQLWDGLARGLSPLSGAVIQKTAGDSAVIAPVRTGSPLLRVEFVGHESATGDRQIAALSPVRRHVTVLNLARTGVTDRGLDLVGQMERLTHLDLRGTAVSDRGIARLAGLEQLRYLNLYGTAVTDSALETLAGLQNLRAVYLWQTEVTATAAADLRAALPDAVIHLERRLPAAPSRGEAPQRSRRRR